MTSTNPSLQDALNWWFQNQLSSNNAIEHFGSLYGLKSALARYILTGQESTPLPDNWSYDALCQLFLDNEYVLAWSNMRLR